MKRFDFFSKNFIFFMRLVSFVLIFAFYSSLSWAGTCTAFVERTCQQDKPCRSSETQTRLVSSVEECIAFARHFCPVYFSEGVASKQVKASFDGSPVPSGNLCR